MKDTVYASQGGRAMHKDPECRAFTQARNLWRFDPREWVPGMPTIMLSNGHVLRELTIRDAFGQGKRPCANCYPTLRGVAHRGEAEDGFGHEPTWIDGGYCGGCEHCGDTAEREVCARCLRMIHTSLGPRRLDSVEWPCATAVVLGLASREGEAA